MPIGKQKRFVLSALAAILVAGVWFIYGYNREPRYEGHPVSYWFREYCFSDTEQPYHDDDEEKAQKAVTTIGTNAVPYLLTIALDTNEDKPVWKAMQAFFDNNFHDSRHRPRFVSQQESRNTAIELIGMIEPPTGLVLPRLHDALRRTNTPGYSQAIFVLSAVANPTNDASMLAPIFAKAIHNPDTMNSAISGLYDVGTNGLVAIPDLITLLQIAVTNIVQDKCADLLGRYGSNSSPALPKLRDLFHNASGARERAIFAAAIFNLDLWDTEALEYLTNSLTNRDDEEQRRWAVARLAYLGPRATSAIPALLNALNTTNHKEWGGLMFALKTDGASNDVVLNRARDSLHSADDQIRVMAAGYLLAQDKSDKDALRTLTSLITNRSIAEEQAIIALGEAGPAAKTALPVLLGVLDGTNSQYWLTVPNALTNMGAPVSLFLDKLEEKLKPEHRREFSDPSDIEQLGGVALELDPGNREIQLLLLRYHDNRAVALNMLGHANPAIPEVKDWLHEELNDEDSDSYPRHAASDALKQIEANEKKK